ncbi:MAG: 5'/3'-nucleotidase SurE [Chloroflexota bacterium]|nr:5'/3'-nucleotidase SurE [Chloroflexota bacterium]
MKILVTNDDGVDSPGLWEMVGALKDLGEVVVAAPDREQSGIGTATTLLEVVKAREVDTPPVEGVHAYAVEGTPADCAILAIEQLSPGGFDIVLSGINAGSNLGLDLFASGTVGGAFQGYFRGIPSIAVSVASLTNVQHKAGAAAAASLARAITANEGMPPLFLNVNLPNALVADIKGAEMTNLGPRLYLETVERGSNGRWTYYWIKHNRFVNPPTPADSDIHAVRNNRIAITALNSVLQPGVKLPSLQYLADGVVSDLGLASEATAN